MLQCASRSFYSHLLQATKIPSCTDALQSAFFLSCIVMQNCYPCWRFPNTINSIESRGRSRGSTPLRYPKPLLNCLAAETSLSASLIRRLSFCDTSQQWRTSPYSSIELPTLLVPVRLYRSTVRRERNLSTTNIVASFSPRDRCAKESSRRAQMEAT
jgi:hypothetical protein